MSEPSTGAWPLEPFPLAVPERRSRARPRRLGAVRLPLGGPYRPLATLYELPDGRRLWLVRLWEIDRPVRRCLSTRYLLAFARLNGLDELAREIRRVAGGAE